MEHYLSAEKISRYRTILIETRNKCVNRIEENREASRELQNGSRGDVVDIANEQDEYLASKREDERMRTKIERINEILSDMEDFGYCLECGEEIGEPRLNFNPTFRHCVFCADIAEKKEKHFR